jgi:HD domain
MTKLGTMTWMERTGGRLAWHDRLTLIGQGVQARLAANKQRRVGTKLRNREVLEILPPDSAITREAIAMAQECSPPYLLNHCLRAYFWARLLDADARPFDDEAVFVALMLHDLGLTDRWRLQGQAHHCFTVVGAKAAEELAARHQWAAARAHVAANAITLHLNVTVGDEHGKEAQMVRAGSGGDVAGLGLSVLERDQIADVVDRYPRLGLKSEVVGPLMTETAERPCCRTAFLCRSLGFVDLIRGNRVFSE